MVGAPLLNLRAARVAALVARVNQKTRLILSYPQRQALALAPASLVGGLVI